MVRVILERFVFFRRPVIHLRIDIDGILTVPWRIQLVIPDTLQGGGLAARLRR